LKTAVLDIGTNSIKAFVCSEGKIISLRKFENRLGKGFTDSIPPENVKETIDVLHTIQKELDVSGTTAFGTEIFRVATNSRDVLEQIKTETGISIRVLSHDEELDVYWKGLMKDFKHDGVVAAIDIGGGTVQFMYGDKDGLQGRHKLKLGVLFLRERFCSGDPLTEEEFTEMEKYIDEQLSEVDVQFPSGTPFVHGATAVIDFYTEAGHKMVPKDFGKSHPWKVDLADTEEFHHRTRCLPFSERAKIYPSNPKFTDGSGIGLSCLLCIAKKTGLTYEVPSNNNIVHGFLD